MKITAALAFLSIAIRFASAASADTFGNGLDSVDIEFVTIGNPGNADDTSGDPNPAGKVDYTYRIGKFEISEDMIDKANTLGNLGITKDTRGRDKPATDVSWLEAAKFVNWLNASKGSTPAYKFNADDFELWLPSDAGYDPSNLYRNSQARYFLPSMDEWYKAAYYDAGFGIYYDFPTGSNTRPNAVASGIDPNTAVYEQPFSQGPADVTQAGGLSPYGTMGQGGNVFEWEETDLDLLNDSTSSDRRGVRGTSWGDSRGFSRSEARLSGLPSGESYSVGFRVASINIPEPSTSLLGAIASVVLMMWRRT